MGWLEEHKTEGRPTKGIIIAAQHDTRLRYALKNVKDVEVYLYRVSFKLDEFKPARNTLLNHYEAVPFGPATRARKPPPPCLHGPAAPAPRRRSRSLRAGAVEASTGPV